jgi:hypothetical protein
MIKDNWFKLVIVVLAIVGIILGFNYGEARDTSEKQLQILKICMGTVNPDSLKDYESLKINLGLCDKLSREFR